MSITRSLTRSLVRDLYRTLDDAPVNLAPGEGVGSISVIATLAAVGISTFAAVGSITGTASASGVGASIAAAAGSISVTATVSGVSEDVAAARDEGHDPTTVYTTTADYYVDQATGDDGNTGTSVGAAFATIQAGIDAASGGADVSVAVRAGTYREGLNFNGLTFSTKCRLHRYADEVVTVSGFEVLTGWTQCTGADETLVGSNYASVYKVDLPSGSAVNVDALNLHEDGYPLHLARDFGKAATDDGFSVRDPTIFHTADDFTFNGGTGDIETVQDASVFANYNSTQLLNATITLLAQQNQGVQTTITAFDDVDTVTVGTGVQPLSTNSYDHMYGLTNLGGAIQQGEYFFNKTPNGDGSTTIYIWPNDTANLTSGIEYSARDICIDLSDTDNIHIEGLICVGPAGDGVNADSGIVIGCRTNTSTAQSNIKIDNCVLGSNQGEIDVYGAVFLSKVDDFEITNNTIRYCRNSVASYMGSACTNGIFRGNYVHHVTRTPLWIYGTDSTTVSSDIIVDYNKFELTGRDAHSNKAAVYIGSRRILFYANDYVDCNGYLTPQVSTQFFAAFNKINVPIVEAYGNPAGLGAEYRGFNDQNGGTIPTGTAICATWNNWMTPNPNRISSGGVSMELGGSNANDWYWYNNICHGGGDVTGTHTGGTGGNFYTHNGTGGSNASNQPTPVASDTEEDVYSTYEDPDNEDFTIKGTSSFWTHTGEDISAWIASDVQSYFSGYDFTKDFYGNTINWNTAGPGIAHDNSAAGTITVTATLAAVGAPIAAATGSITASATLAAVGSTAGVEEAVGTISASATVSGVGASIAAATGSITASATLAAVGADGSATINDVAFDATTWHSFTAPTAAVALTMAFKIRRVNTSVTIAISSEGANNTRVRFSSGTISNLYVIVEETSGTARSLTSSGTYAVNDELAVVIGYQDGNQKLMINGSLVAGDTLALSTNFKMPALINSSTAAGSDQNVVHLIGPIFIANEYVDPETFWSSFYDGSNDPVFTSTVEGVTADFFVDENAAGWNALGGTTGTVTDN